jgi:hypothetical protein
MRVLSQFSAVPPLPVLQGFTRVAPIFFVATGTLEGGSDDEIGDRRERLIDLVVPVRN